MIYLMGCSLCGDLRALGKVRPPGKNRPEGHGERLRRCVCLSSSAGWLPDGRSIWVVGRAIIKVIGDVNDLADAPEGTVRPRRRVGARGGFHGDID